MLQSLVIATANPGKIREIREILRDLPLQISTRDDFDSWPVVEETGDTYLDNALLKARALVELTGLAALADDSGIEVDHLGGAPGVQSAYFAGPRATDDENNARLIAALDGVPEAKRTARYRCVAVVVEPSGRFVQAEATCEGRIAQEPRGANGFGYDPWFIPEGESRHMAELTPQEKHAISHRGRALRALISLIETLLVEK